MKSLQLLALDGTSAGSKSIETIATLPELVQLICPDGITNADLAKLGALKKLGSLVASRSGITDEGLNALKAMPALIGISFEYSKGITDKGAAVLAEIKTLTSVNLYATSVTVQGWRQLTMLPNLRAVGPGAIQPAEELHKVLAGIPTLTQVIGTPGIDGSNLEFYKNHPALAEIWFADPKLGDDRIPIVVTLKKLTRLNIKGSKITREGFEKLKAALPKCRIEWDGGVIEPKP